MSLLSDSKTFTRFWAAVMSDLESIFNSFVSQQDWTYPAFAKVFRDNYGSLLLTCTHGRGPMKKEQEKRIMELLFSTVKDFWVYTAEISVEKPEIDLVFLKRKLAALYTLYTLYFKQPREGEVKIMIDAKDMDKIDKFENDCGKLYKFEIDIDKMVKMAVMKLKLNGAFVFCVDSGQYGIDIFTRSYLNVKLSETTKLMMKAKDNADASFGNPYMTAYVDAFHQLKLTKLNVVTGVIESGQPIPIPSVGKDEEALGEILQLAKASFDKPIFTAQSLIAHESIDKIKINEARKRIEHIKKKEELEEKKGKPGAEDAQPDPNQKKPKPYVRPGGIFGRKNDAEKKTKGGKKCCSQASENLWTYIRS